MLEQFARFGRELFLQGVNSSHSGNMSIRAGDRIFITRRGSMLANLREGDIIETGLRDDDSHITLVSTEIKIHRAVYQHTSALAMVHAHPPFAIALSIDEDEIGPIDTEGIYYFKSIPVIAAALTVGSDEVEQLLPPLLENYKAAMVRGHGSFAVGQMLEEAFQWTSSLEASCKVLFSHPLLAPQGRKEAGGKW
ncbi:MAG: fuculose phosphate aldolase [Candidatus Solincola sediminis]|uniref:Fuculose phosphate aldolase n=1 Tax=Candidatus Solincola sediminis TaxID=1797199 RepID=A0A1F2WIY7_9ACTN|nr:MAG: fuculose phosphate aldolase [Candidatus Solincola sediminis]OFW61067.1 MAG: fuculose phosphate aldolase [Candidatus Solincola sediminis]